MEIKLDNEKHELGILFAIILLSFFCYIIFRPFLMALSMGTVFAIALLPIFKKLRYELKGRPTLAAVLVTIFFVIFILMPISFSTYKLIQYGQQHPDLFSSVTGIEKKIFAKLSNISRDLNFDLDFERAREMYAKAFSGVKTFISRGLEGLLTRIPEVMLQFTIMIVRKWFKDCRLRKVYQESPGWPVKIPPVGLKRPHAGKLHKSFCK